jgi:hypothetical protein
MPQRNEVLPKFPRSVLASALTKWRQEWPRPSIGTSRQYDTIGKNHLKSSGVDESKRTWSDRPNSAQFSPLSLTLHFQTIEFTMSRRSSYGQPAEGEGAVRRKYFLPSATSA